MRRVAALLALGLVLPACGLPLTSGIRNAQDRPAGQQQRGDIQVLPPGPSDDAAPDQVVRDFFGAQSSPDDGHARAREFLAPERRGWKDSGPVQVFAGPALTVAPVGEAKNLFQVTGTRTGRIAADGSYTPVGGTLSVRVGLRQNERGRWVITEVPDGLLLSTADRDRSFKPYAVYFLASTTGQTSSTTHLVPDPLFVPVTADPADALVRRLLAGPSSALGDSADTAVPDATRLLKPVQTDANGVVTVDLSAQVGAAPPSQQEQLSAQLVWTLRGVASAFSKLRLRSAGRDLRVASSGDPAALQDRGDWASYDPDGLPARAPALYLSGRRLRSLDAGLIGGPASDVGSDQAVDRAASAPRGGSFALLRNLGKRWQLSTGPVTGPFDVRWQARFLASPSFGSGDLGVWFSNGSQVLLAPSAGRPFVVPVEGVGRYGPVTALRVSRDGARIALVAGVGPARQLLVGRVRTIGGRIGVVGLRRVAPGLTDVRDVCWESATSLVVLGRTAGALLALPVRVAVDGSTVAPLIRVGLETSEPVSIAAAPGRPLVVGATINGQPVLFRDNGRSYAPEPGTGTAPFYPG